MGGAALPTLCRELDERARSCHELGCTLAHGRGAVSPLSPWCNESARHEALGAAARSRTVLEQQAERRARMHAALLQRPHVQVCVNVHDRNAASSADGDRTQRARGQMSPTCSPVLDARWVPLASAHLGWFNKALALG